MKPKNCWEYWNCPKETKEKCPAYTTDSGKDCYDLARDFCPKVTNEFKHCWECPWYKIVHNNDSSKNVDAEHRHAERLAASISVDVIEDSAHFSGIIEDISQSGIGTQIISVPITDAADFNITPGTDLKIKIRTLHEKGITLKCKVKWTKTDKERRDGIVYVFGAEITDPPEEFLELVKSL